MEFDLSKVRVGGNPLKQTESSFEFDLSKVRLSTRRVSNDFETYDVNKDNTVDLKDLVAEKKKQRNGELLPEYKNNAQQIRTYLTSPSARYNSRVNSAIDKLNNGKLTVKGQSDLVETLVKAKDDSTLSQDERDYYGNLYNEFADFEKQLNFNLEAGHRDIDYYESELAGIKNVEKLISKLESENATLELGAAKGGIASRAKLEENKAKIAEYKADLEEAYKKYGSKDELSAFISEKKVFLSKATRLQDGISLFDVADPNSENYDPEFEKYSEKGAALADKKSWAESTKNIVAKWRNNPKQLESWEKAKDLFNGAAGESVLNNQLNYLAAKYMTDEEFSVYNYYLAKENDGLMEKGTANKFLKSIKDVLTDRQGIDIAEDKNSKVSKYAYGYKAGVDQFTQGIINRLNFEDDYIPATGTQKASSIIRSDIKEQDGTFGQIAYDMINTTSNMLPSILTSAAIGMINPTAGTAVGATLMGTSASGNAYQEMLNLGYDKKQANSYSILVGVSEAALSYAFSGISKLGGKITDNVLKKAVASIENGFAQFAIQFGGKIGSEALEEAAQEVLTPIFENIALGYEKNSIADTDWGAVAYSGLLGALSAAPSSAIDAAKSVRKYDQNRTFAQQVDNVINGTHDVNYDLYVSETPQVFTDLGFTNTALLMRNGKVREILNKHSEMSVDTIKKIPEALKNPILILKSKTHPTQSVVAITDIQTDKGNMIVPVWVNQSGNYIDVDLGIGIKKDTNFVATAYGRNLKGILEYANENEGFLYQDSDTEKVRQLLTQYGLQLPTPLKLSDSNINIAQNDTDVNNNISTSNTNNSENSTLQSSANPDGTADEAQATTGGTDGKSDVVSPNSEKQSATNLDDVLDEDSDSESGTAEEGGSTTYGGIDTDNAKHLNKAQQDEIKAIGKKLGRTVKFEDFYNLEKFKGKKKIPDGYIDKDGNIHINFSAKRPVYFLFKHEITHYLKRNQSAYQDFMNLVFKSKAFVNWIHNKGYASIKELKSEIMNTYSEVKGFDEAKCYDEILADFVGEYLFGGKNAISQELINALEPKQKKTFFDVIKDIISYFKKKFSENARIKAEITKIEQEFIKVYNEAVKTNKPNNDIEVQYAIKYPSYTNEAINNNMKTIAKMSSVYDVPSEKLEKSGKRPSDMFSEYFSSLGNVIHTKEFGDISLSNSSVKSEIRHGITAEKIASIEAIPSVLDKGKVIFSNTKPGTDVERLVVCAPITIASQSYYMGIMLQRDTQSQRLYLHNVLIEKEMSKTSQADLLTTGALEENEHLSITNILQRAISVKNNSMQESEDYSIPTLTNPEILLESYENGEITREEYLNALKKEKVLNPVEIANLSKKDSDTTPQHIRKKGESDGDKTSKFYGSLLESDIFDQQFKNEVVSDTFIEKYKSVTNKETLKAAAKELDEGGRSYVSKWWAIKPERASLIDTAVGFILMDRYQRIGDYESAIAITEKVREFGTAGGQQVQIFSIIGRLDPNAMAVYAQRELSKAFETLVEGRSKKWIDRNSDSFNLTEDEIEFIRLRTLQAAQLPEGRDKAIRLAEICTLLQNKLPPQKGQRIRALQRISMLLNVKTNIRNITGNAIMTPVFIASDFFGSGIDKIVSQKFGTGVRTTGNFDINSVKGLKKGAYETMDDFRRHINTRNEELNRFDIGSGKAFNENHNRILAKQLNECAKVLNALDRFTSMCLELGDRPFYEMWYINSLNNQMRLNNVKESTPEMIAIASAEALQRTWQDSNKVVEAISKVKSALNVLSIGGYGLGDVYIKFVKTPANLTKAIFDFSPAGLCKAIAADGKVLKNAIETGHFQASMQKKFVDSLSKGITGTLLYVLAAALASKGLLSGSSDEDKDAANFEKYIQGIPEYSIKLFGKWYSYEWVQPVGAVAATVTEYMKYAKANPDNEWYENVWGAIQAGGEVLYNQSFMQSIQNLFTADNVVDGALEAILSEPSVFVPQLLSQAANVSDDYRRVSYSNNKPFETALNKVKAKIPGLRQTLEKQVDILGRDVQNSQGDFINAFINPANTFTNTSTEVTDELYKIYKQTKDKTVMPRTVPYSITVKGNTYSFSAEERSDFQRISGSTSNDLLKTAFENGRYKELSDEEKVKLVKKIYDFSAAYAKSSLEYGYETLSAMIGEYDNGKPVLTEKEYNKLPEAAREQLAQEYFFSKTEFRLMDDYEGLIRYYIGQISK